MAKASPRDAQRLARLSPDCSFLLTHLIRQNGKEPKTDAEARRDLLSILGLVPQGSPLIRASLVGWYTTASAANVFRPASNDFAPRDPVSSVCFTESSLAGLRAHRAVFRAKYGLAFDRDWLYSKGANPCLNIRDEILKAEVPTSGQRRHVYNYIPDQLHPFVNVINVAFDATHEREWRLSGDLHFRVENLKIVFCPESAFKRVAAIQKRGRPMLFDLAWLDRY